MMGCLTIYKDNYTEATAVSNIFIDEYMKDANDAQLKVYLYLIRMMNANLPTSVSDIADKFNHTEKDVLRALKYWEKKRLLSLEYDDSNSLIGIHLLDLNKPRELGGLANPDVCHLRTGFRIVHRSAGGCRYAGGCRFNSQAKANG